MAEITGTGALTLPAVTLAGAGKRWDKNYVAIAAKLVPTVRAALTFADFIEALEAATVDEQTALLAEVRNGAQRATGEQVLALVNAWVTAEATAQAQTACEGDTFSLADLGALL
jgi:hypothetical protein